MQPAFEFATQSTEFTDKKSGLRILAALPSLCAL